MRSDEHLLWQRRFLAPNHVIELRPDGMTVLQVLPLEPGRSLLRRHYLTRCPEDRPALAADYLASRLSPYATRAALAVVESTQAGIATFGHEPAEGAQTTEALAAFRRQLLALMPAMRLPRPPNGA